MVEFSDLEFTDLKRQLLRLLGRYENLGIWTAVLFSLLKGTDVPGYEKPPGWHEKANALARSSDAERYRMELSGIRQYIEDAANISEVCHALYSVPIEGPTL